MKQHKIKTFLSILFCLLVQLTNAQKTEINFNAYSGLFSFQGPGTTLNSWVSFGNFSVSTPYSRKPSFFYSFELQGQRITKKKNIYGIGLSFEAAKKNTVNIDSAFINNSSSYGFTFGPFGPGIYEYDYPKPATGKSILENTFITVNPFVGHRFIYKKFSVDVLAGIDLGFCKKSFETTHANNLPNIRNDSFSIYFEDKRVKPSIDLRPRVQFKLQYHKLGLLAGYSLGITDYQKKNKAQPEFKNIPIKNGNTYSRILRLGISWELK